MKNVCIGLAAAMTAGFVATAAGQVPFTPGNVVVLRVGDGAASLSNAATPVFLEEISPMGVLVQAIAMPTVASSAGTRAATMSGTATAEGALNLSVDGRFLTYGGYNADVGTPGVASTTSDIVNRVAARIAADGTVDTTTAFSDATYSGNSIRSVVSTDGIAFWTSGHASSVFNAGVRYASLNSSSSERLSGTVTNVRVVNIFDGQLYVSAQSGSFRGINTVGVGVPTDPDQTIELLPGFDPVGISPHGFFFADVNTLYTADERTLTNGGGLQKWTFDGTNWTHAYTMQTGLSSGLRAVTGIVDRAGTTLYVITADAIASFAGNRLMRIVDTGEFSDFVLIATAPGNTAFRGVAFTPEAGDPTCYANCDSSTTQPVLNVEDFVCFINEFAAGLALAPHLQINHYANCDNSTTDPVLNVEDFICFIDAFAQGCP
jgi:hypothetical protein